MAIKDAFYDTVNRITDIGVNQHKQDILKNCIRNAVILEKTINDLELNCFDKAIVVSAGPSLHYSGTLQELSTTNFNGPIIAIDGSYVKCLRAGIIPDYLLTLDPHPTRLVRWFGDPDFEKNMIDDDYYSRQDLDIDFRNNSIKQNNENIELVNEYAGKTKLMIASTAPANVVSRAKQAGFDMYWWIPLVDDPDSKNSLTRKMFEITEGLPALNTGGNVGTAAWVFAQFWLKCKRTAVIGMDLGYKNDMPYEMTQTYPELVSLLGKENVNSSLFPQAKNHLTGEKFYTDPTYYWYKQNLLELINNSGVNMFNCTEGGTLSGKGVEEMKLVDFISMD